MIFKHEAPGVAEPPRIRIGIAFAVSSDKTEEYPELPLTFLECLRPTKPFDNRPSLLFEFPVVNGSHRK